MKTGGAIQLQVILSSICAAQEIERRVPPVKELEKRH